jgi:hypothetical protein
MLLHTEAKLFWIACKIGLFKPWLRAQSHTGFNGRGEPTASSLSADGFPLMTGPNFQALDGNLAVISILRQLADGPENVPKM